MQLDLNNGDVVVVEDSDGRHRELQVVEQITESKLLRDEGHRYYLVDANGMVYMLTLAGEARHVVQGGDFEACPLSHDFHGAQSRPKVGR